MTRRLGRQETRSVGRANRRIEQTPRQRGVLSSRSRRSSFAGRSTTSFATVVTTRGGTRAARSGLDSSYLLPLASSVPCNILFVLTCAALQCTLGVTNADWSEQ